MQGQSEKNIIPIFSKRKRPRQALYAFPGKDAQNTGSASSPASYNQPSLNSGSNQYGNNPASNTRVESWQDTSNAPQHQPMGERSGNTYYGSNRPINQSSTTTTNKRMINYYPGSSHKASNQTAPSYSQQQQQQSGNMKRPLNTWQPKYDEPMPSKTSRPSASPAQHPTYQQYPQRSSSQVLQGQSFASGNPHTSLQRTPMHQQNVHQSKMGQQPLMRQPPLRQPSTHQPASCSPRPHGIQHGPTGYQDRGSSSNAPSPFRMPSTPQMPPRTMQPGSGAWEMRRPDSAGCAVDKSMKMLTVSIEELRYWTVSRDIQGLLFFELFGILNSAVCSNESGLAKKFTLKDGNHTLQCVFYETDRPLGLLTRGHCLRCVGNILPKEGVFRCVSVRPATQSEQKVMRSLVAACDRGVRERLSATRIEP